MSPYIQTSSSLKWSGLQPHYRLAPPLPDAVLPGSFATDSRRAHRCAAQFVKFFTNFGAPRRGSIGRGQRAGRIQFKRVWVGRRMGMDCDG